MKKAVIFFRDIDIKVARTLKNQEHYTKAHFFPGSHVMDSKFSAKGLYLETVKVNFGPYEEIS